MAIPFGARLSCFYGNLKMQAEHIDYCVVDQKLS